MISHLNSLDSESLRIVWANPSVRDLIQHCLERDGEDLTTTGAVVATTGKYTGRTPKNKFVVRDETTEGDIWWENNHPITPDEYARIRTIILDYARERELYQVDAYAGADPAHQIKVRILAERAYHALFIKQMLIRPSDEQLAAFEPEWTILDAGKLKLDPAVHGTPDDAIIMLNFQAREVLIAGTEYAGEIKKGVFTIMNRILPETGVLSLHGSANIGADGRTALFFGLSGTGKTTLSADPERRLIGDDEHGWGDSGVFNIEGGCYAKCINLSQSGEPEIWDAIRTGAVLENVVLHDGVPDYNDGSLTENTRVAYPLEHIANAVHPSVGGHPKDIVFLTSDAFGVLPPISRLTPDQTMEWFMAGYTAKLAGTEVGVTEPQPVFSTCFGQPFLPLHPQVYADLLRAKIAEHGSKVWLVNTGWTGGPYGIGHRMKLAHTRAMLHAAFSGALDNVEYEEEPAFGLHIPKTCPDVPNEVLAPRNTWSDGEAYDRQALDLRTRFAAALKSLG
jgi:phosphoenolpyruvate carboxykinase (ATP)